MKTCLTTLAAVAAVCLFANAAAMAAGYPQLNAPPSSVHPAAQIQNAHPPNPNYNFHVPFVANRFPQPDVCRVRSFFSSDISKPLDAVYFARHGTGCAGYNPFYGFVTFSR